MTKKIISIILALLLILGVVAGCGANNEAEESQSQSETKKEEKLAAYEVGYSLTDEEKTTNFFMDRQYALDSDNAKVTDEEMAKAKDWLTKYVLEPEDGKCAYDFKIDGKSVTENLSEWTLETNTEEDDDRMGYILSYTKDGEPITFMVYAYLYKNYPVAEYTVWVSNESMNDKSGQITEFNALNGSFAQGFTDNEVRLTTFEGGHEANTSFRAENRVLEADKKVSINGTGGKPSVTWSPYFNLQWLNDGASWGKEGIFFSVGWPGQWGADILKTADGVEVKAMQQRMNTYLNAGEIIRSPLMTMLFWEKDMMRSQNIWRDWLYNVAMYQPNGEPIPTILHGNTAQDTNLVVTATTENQVEAIKKWVEYGFDIDLWQMDAGWYDMANGSTSWVDTGSWTPSAERFGGSLKKVSDTLHENGIKLILWYEPERMVTDSVWYNQFKDTDFIIKDSGWHCFNLANNEAADFLIDFMKTSIKDNGIDIYRQDCNLNDAQSLNYYWKRFEDKDRAGFTENRYVINYLRYFDEINKATGNFIDNCASGGKRLDLESTKCAVACWRDDKCYDATLTQCQSWGINFFMPYSGQGSLDQSSGTMKYTFRSNMMPYTGLPWKLSLINKDNIDLHKQMIAEHRQYAHYLTQQYYPLTPFTEAETDWMAWQFNDATDSTGIIQVFKRTESSQREAVYYLNGLEADTTYKVTDIDTGDAVEMTGKALMCDGIKITLQEDFAAEMFYYEPVK